METNYYKNVFNITSHFAFIAGFIYTFSYSNINMNYPLLIGLIGVIYVMCEIIELLKHQINEFGGNINKPFVITTILFIMFFDYISIYSTLFVSNIIPKIGTLLLVIYIIFSSTIITKKEKDNK